MFREAMANKQQFLVNIGDDEFVTEADSVNDVITTLIESVGDEFKPKVNATAVGEYSIAFSKYKIRNKTSVTIKTIT